MKHLGDITKIDGSAVPPVDVITGGSPCQDLSVAGKRAGLAGERSGLFMDQIRIIKEMRNESRLQGSNDDIRPRFMVWENVPGAFSSNGGEDFRAVLEETARVAEGDAVIPRPANGKWTHAGCIMGDGWSIAWRVHDAQFWGVPQRRKRIALVADFGGSTAPEILFEREGLSGDTTESGKQGEGATEDAEGCVDETGRAISFQERAGKPGGSKGIPIQKERTGALSTLNNQSVCAFEPGATSRVGGHVYEDGKAGTVRANAGDNQQAVVYGISAYDSNAMKSDNPHSGIYEADTSRTLDLNGGSPACNQGGMAVVQGADMYNGSLTGNIAATLNATSGDSPTHSGPSVVCLEGNGSRPSHRGDGYAESETMYTLNSTEHHAVAVENHPADSRVKISEDGVVQTLSGRMGTGGGNVPMVMESKAVESHAQDAGYNVGNVNQPLTANMEHDPANGGLVMETYQKTTGSSWNGSQVSPTLTANNAGGSQRMPDKENFNAVLSYGLDRAAYNQGKNAKYNFSVDQGKWETCVAKGPNAVASFYPQMKAESQCWREDDVSNTLVNGTNPGFQNGICTPVVRRLTPLECERLQGFPVVRKVRFTEMTKDEYIAWNISEGNIIVDTEYGKVFATRGPGGVKLDEPKELTGSILNGYRVVSIRNGETKMQCRVHRIVWITEHGIIPDGYVIDHINNDKQDNRLCNLQLLTAAENSTKAREDGLYKIHGDAGCAKITDEVHDFIQYVYGNTDLSIRQLSEIFGISKSRVHQIIHDEPWTDIGDWVDSKGKTHKGDSDAPRYKALGNSIALPFWQWMAKKMMPYLGEEPTMASLFSGIGGFELVFSRAGCKPVWASEVENFAIAVTKRRFGEDESN